MDTPTQAQAAPEPASAAALPGSDNQPSQSEIAKDLIANGSLAQLDELQTAGRTVLPATPAGGGVDKPVAAEPVVVPEPAKPAVVEPEKPVVASEPVVEPVVTEPVVPAKPVEAEPDELPNRFRFKDPTDRAIVAVHKAAEENGQPISWGEAERKVRGESVEPVTVVSPIALAQTEIGTLTKEITDLEATLEEAGKSQGLFTPEIAQATKDLAAKRMQLAKSEFKLENAQADEEADRAENAQVHRQARQGSKDRAMAAYPDMGKEDSKLSIEVAKEFAAMKMPDHPDHPILYADSAPEMVTERVAKRLGIQPAAAKPASPTPTVQPTVATPPAKPIVSPVSGAKTSVPVKPAEDKKATKEYLLGNEASLDELDAAQGGGDLNQLLSSAVR